MHTEFLKKDLSIHTIYKYLTYQLQATSLNELKSPKSVLVWTMRQRNRENKPSIIGSIIFVPSRLKRRKALFMI
jgi:hypothetical protein